MTEYRLDLAPVAKLSSVRVKECLEAAVDESADLSVFIGVGLTGPEDRARIYTSGMKASQLAYVVAILQGELRSLIHTEE